MFSDLPTTRKHFIEYVKAQQMLKNQIDFFSKWLNCFPVVCYIGKHYFEFESKADIEYVIQVLDTAIKRFEKIGG